MIQGAGGGVDPCENEGLDDRVTARISPLGADESAQDAAERRKGEGLRLSESLFEPRSLVLGLIVGVAFFLLGSLCLSLSRFDTTLASVWLPNASVVALLLLARPRNEAPVFLAVAVAGVAANLLAGNTPQASLVYAAGNCLDIALVTWLTRRATAGLPDMSDLSDLGQFIKYGGIVGPGLSALLIAPWTGADANAILTEASAWFLADSLGMLLVVPAVLTIADRASRPQAPADSHPAEQITLMVAGFLAVFLVFAQTVYPLLFLVPPITLLVAFRIGSVGTVLYAPGIAIIASWMTYSGLGPIFQNNTSDISKIYVLQSFVAANFLTGLPVAAILAGRERMTEELTRGRRELALLTEGITDAVMLIDRKGVCRYASPSVADVLGRDAEELLGRSVTERTHEDARDRIANALDKLLSGASDKERLAYRRLHDDENGRPVFIEADCAIVTDAASEEPSGIVVSARDVTERVELELLLTRARRSAERAANAKSEFLANMSHEIRTPMNGVLGFAELMLRGDLDEENRKHAEMIVQSGRTMMMLLNDILDLSKIEAGQVGIAKESVDVAGTIAECISLYRPSAEKKGLSIACRLLDGDGQSVEPGAFPWVISDGLRLRQILLNLIGNAVKFTESGGVCIVARAEDETLSIAVEDSGIGISSQRLETIFAPFTQGESDTARRFGGTGLGLTISQQLAGLLGGSIKVSSTPGAGSTFEVSLPGAYVAAERRAEKEPDLLEPGDFPQSARILLAEDHDVNRLLGRQMLEECGQEVSIAHDGNEAIAMVIDSVMRDRPYDLVFMDIQMPGCDGYAATRAIRAEGIGPDTMPIIALTANAFPEDIKTAREAGMQAHLSKPLNFADLARALQRWLPTRIVEDARSADAPQGRDPVDPPAPVKPPVAAIDEKPRENPNGASRSADPAPTQSHSPELLGRWRERRSEAVEAVRSALEDGALGEEARSSGTHEDLARVVHKLAGTAAIFGEPALGDQAAAFENALRMKLPGDVRESLAFELLKLADDPADASAGVES